MACMPCITSFACVQGDFVYGGQTLLSIPQVYAGLASIRVNQKVLQIMPTVELIIWRWNLRVKNQISRIHFYRIHIPHGGFILALKGSKPTSKFEDLRSSIIKYNQKVFFELDKWIKVVDFEFILYLYSWIYDYYHQYFCIEFKR